MDDYAQSFGDEGDRSQWQPLADHLVAVAKLAERFACEAPSGSAPHNIRLAQFARPRCHAWRASSRQKSTLHALILRKGLIEPMLRVGMLVVRIEGQCQPDVNVGEQHLLRRESRRSFARSSVRCPVHRCARGALRFAACLAPAPLLTARDSKRLPSHPPARPERPPIQRRRSAHDRESPCPHFRSPLVREQVESGAVSLAARKRLLYGRRDGSQVPPFNPPNNMNLTVNRSLVRCGNSAVRHLRRGRIEACFLAAL